MQNKKTETFTKLERNSEEGDGLEHHGILEMKGTIYNSSAERSPATAIFSFLKQGGDLDILSGMKFETTPGYELWELNKQEVKLYDSIRDIVADYFSSNPK